MQHRSNPVSDRIVYVVDGARTPFLKARAEPGPFTAAELAISAGKALLERQPFSASEFDQVIVGCAGPSPDEANIARIISLRLGCGNLVPAWTVQRNCASGLQAIDSAVQSIQNGKSSLVLSGGTEAMSRMPLLLNESMTKWLARMQQAKSPWMKIKTLLKLHPKFFVPIVGLLKGLTDPVVNLNMGQTAEELAYRFNIDRKAMDDLAIQSHLRAIEGQMEGVFDEITPLYGKDGTVYEQDDGIRKDSTHEKLSKLKPVFEKHGSITAGNSSQISDGAAFVILASKDAVERYQLPVLAKIVDVEWAALDPAVMGLGPVHAMIPLLKRNHLQFKDLKHIEINEAFAAQVIACCQAFNDPDYCKQFGLEEAMGEIDFESLNPHGGAIAMGHPVGASGARLVLHCAKMLERNKHPWAVASLCIGGGQGGAILMAQDGVRNG